MDPNAALNNIREAVGELRQQDDDGVLDGTSQVGFLLESFEALDEWLTRGGFLPGAWKPLPEPAQKVVDECIAEAWRNTEQNDATADADVAADIAQRLYTVYRVRAHDDGNERILGVINDWTDEEFELALGFPRPKPGPGQPGSIGVTGPDGRMVWRYDYEHTHEYQGQKLTHSHKHHGPHGYFEHPEDVGAPVEPGFDTDVPYTREDG